ncbi:MAG TPA: GNAT family N-acetyltransferase [Gemmatimonadaceae bacterium]
MTGEGGLDIRDNEQLGRYELATEGGTAILTYRRKEDAIILVHTEVPEALRGRNLANRLARLALNEARRDGRRVVVKCPFVSAFIRRHPEYADLVDGGRRGEASGGQPH